LTAVLRSDTLGHDADPRVTAPSDVTILLRAWREGDARALDRLIPIVYEELKDIARRSMWGERPDHTLQATALVHEAYTRLIDSDVTWQDRSHFFAVAARQMRRILVDHAKARGRIKRGGGADRITLNESVAVSPEPPADLVALDEALERLTALDARKAQVIELHFFGGLTHEEAAEALGVSVATVERDLRFAKAWLYRELQPEA
jgi:RNA polymerase sigma factor (TIGR02999 family)